MGIANAQDSVPKHEVGLTLGGLLGSQRSGGTTKLDFGSGMALQANYGLRLAASNHIALYSEVHMLASPQRQVSSTNLNVTRDIASLYVTPGIRVKFVPHHAVAPYFAVGAGWADYEHSTTTIGGGVNRAPRNLGRGVFDYGGGVDLKFRRIAGINLALRAEIRDFYSGPPAFNAVGFGGDQHNVVAGGGLVLRFR